MAPILAQVFALKFLHIMSKLRNLFADLFGSFLSSVFILVLFYHFIALPEMVYGSSMVPTLHSRDRVILEKVSRHFRPYSRGDIVILHPPEHSDVDYIKRIVGLPGESIKVKDCHVYISQDGSRFILEEPYLAPGTCTSAGPFLREGRSVYLKEGEYVVMGDNRSNSLDSRFFGVVTDSQIQGRVLLRFWPLDKLRFL